MLTWGQVALPADYKVNESPDYTAFYYPVAERVVDGNGLTVPDGRVADRFPPGYPVFLAGVITVADATGLGRASLITAASLVLHALGCLLLFAFARAFVRPWAACLGALTWGLSPVALWLTKQPNSELVFTVVVLGALVLVVPLLRPGSRAGVVRLTGVGALLGAAALIRPIAVGIVVPLAVVYLLVHRTAGVRRWRPWIPAWPRTDSTFVTAKPAAKNCCLTRTCRPVPGSRTRHWPRNPERTRRSPEPAGRRWCARRW